MSRYATLSQHKERSPTSAHAPLSVNVRSGSSSASTSSSTASTDAAASTTPTASSGDKKKRKKKKKSSSSAAANGTSNQASPSNRSHYDSTGGNGTTSATDEAPPSTDPSQLPLEQRLEIAAAHSDVHAALVGLLGWSRLYVHTDTILAFFQSRALELLLINIFHTRPTTDAVYDNLTALLTNCVSSERESSVSASAQSAAQAVVTAVRAVVASCDKPHTQDAAPLAAQYLSSLVARFRMALAGGADGDATLAQDVARIDKDLARAAAQDSAVQGQTIRETFQRRDIRCDALALYETRLAKVSQLVRDSVASATQHTSQTQEKDQATDSSTPSGFAAFLATASTDNNNSDDTDSAADDLAPCDPKELESIQQQREAMSARRDAAIAPLTAQKATQSETLSDLRSQRDALEAQLRALNAQIDTAMLTHQALDDEIAAVDATFDRETTAFDSKHALVLAQFARQEQRAQMDAAFATLESTIATISLAQSNVEALEDKRTTCVRQHLEGVLRYFASELPCVKFMRARVEQSETQLQSLTDEVASYTALGVSAVAKELQAKARELESHVQEDRQCLAALQTRDVALLATIERLLTDTEFADARSALDPALLKEVQRHVDYVAKLHSVSLSSMATMNGTSAPAQ